MLKGSAPNCWIIEGGSQVYMDVSVYLRRNILMPWICLERDPGNHLKCNLDRSRRRPQIAALKPEIRARDPN